MLDGRPNGGSGRDRLTALIVWFMDASLLWTVIGTATGIPAVVIAILQLRVQILERRERRSRISEVQTTARDTRGALSVAAPFGRLPVQVRGRGALLAELRKSLIGRRQMDNTWILTGMGGVGKSTVALAVADAARSRGYRVWWVNAADRAFLIGGLLELLGQLDAPEMLLRLIREDAPIAPDRTWEFLNRKHAAGRRWLLIFDAADDPSVLAAAGQSNPADGTGWLRAVSAGMIIVTSRSRNPATWGSRSRIRELEVLDDTTAAQVLTDIARVGDGELNDAKALGRRLGGLPLALHLAGIYLVSPFAQWRSFADYLGALDSGTLPTALTSLDDPKEHMRATVTRTWQISLEALAAAGRPQARTLLFLLSCFAAATPIPTWLLRPELLDGILIPEQPSAEMSGGRQVESLGRLMESTLQGLAGLGLVNIISGDGSYGDLAIVVHPVVADVNRSELLTYSTSAVSAIGETAVRVLRLASEALDTERPEDWPTWRRLVPHVSCLLGWLVPYLDQGGLSRLVTTSVLASDALRRGGSHIAAEQLARSSVAAASTLGNDDPVSVRARSSLALAVAELRYGEAEELFRQLLVDQKRVLGDTDPDTLVAECTLTRLIGLQGRDYEAEPRCRRLLEGYRQLIGNDNPHTLDLLRILADVVARRGRFPEAQRIYEELLADQERIHGKDDPACLDVRRGLVDVIAEVGEPEEAERLYRRMLSDHERILGDDHPGTLAVRRGLARVVAKNARPNEVDRLYRQLLADHQRVLGNEHPDTLAVRSELASEDLGLGEPALERWRSKFGPDDKRTLILAVEIGISMRWGERWEKASRLNSDTLKRLKRVYGENDEVFLQCARSFGIDLTMLGRYADALENDLQLLPLYVKKFGPEHEYTLTLRNNIAVSLRCLGEFTEALAHDRDILVQRRRALGSAHEETLISQFAVARDLRQLGKYEESLDMAQQVTTILEDKGGPWDIVRLLAGMDLSVSLRRVGRHEDARSQGELILERYHDLMGEVHRRSLLSATNLINDRRITGDLHGARQLGERTLRSCEGLAGLDHPNTNAVRANLAIVLRAQGDLVGARQLNERALKCFSSVYGQRHLSTLVVMTNLASDLAEAGDREEARKLGEAALASSRQALGSRHPFIVVVACNLAADRHIAGDESGSQDLRKATLLAFGDSYESFRRCSRTIKDIDRLSMDIEPMAT